MLHTEPSFSVYADEEGLINIEKVDLKVKEGNDEFSFAKNLREFDNLGIVEKEDEGIEAVSINGGDVYKKMVDEDPSNPVLLKNYAHLLQSNGDLDGAEEYYFRATQADPKDGESLMQYAKLVWELHHDQDRALGYFEAAVLAAPEDSYIHAAYASFMWEIDEDDSMNNDTAPIKESLEVDGKCSRWFLETMPNFFNRPRETLQEPKSITCVHYKQALGTVKSLHNVLNWHGNFTVTKTKHLVI